MEVARRRGRRRKMLLDDLKDRRGYSHLKEEALHRTIWRHRFGGGFGPVVRQNTEWMNEWLFPVTVEILNLQTAVPTKRATFCLIKVKWCNALWRVLLGCVCSCEKLALRYNLFILGTYHPDTLYARGQGFEDPWLFLRAKRGPRAKKSGKHWLGREYLWHWSWRLRINVISIY